MFLYILYNIFFVPAFRLAFFLGRFFNKKMKEGYEKRQNQWELISQKMKEIDPKRKRIAFHASSVGEWEQAAPIIDRLKEINPDLFIIASFFSPSGYNFVKNYANIDLKIYLPLDSLSNAKQFFGLIKPNLWVISKFDVWINHLKIAAKMNIPVINTSATLSENSGRDKGLAGRLNAYAYQYFSWIYPISEDDKKRFLKIYPQEKQLIVTGDTRFDQVFLRGEKAKKKNILPIFADNSGIKFIGGSIWQADEKRLFPALLALLKKYDSLKLVLVPHEIKEHYLKEIEDFFVNFDCQRFTKFSLSGSCTSRIAIIDTVGMLAALYAQTDIAYVGGSFTTGVHNTMEPAIFGNPVIFGSVYQNSFEAMELMKLGSAFSCANSAQMQEVLEKLITDQTYRKQIGENAKSLIINNIGASEKIIQQLIKNYDFISEYHTN